MRGSSAAAVAALVLCALETTGAFTQTPFRAAAAGLAPAARSAAGAGHVLPACSASDSRRRVCAASALTMSGRRMRVSPRNVPGGSAAKRAGRLGKLVMTELVGILRSPYSIKVAGGNVDAELASLISVVEVDMSGDNKVAKVMVSAMGSDVEKKRAVMWLNKNARAIRFSLAQRISYLKTAAPRASAVQHVAMVSHACTKIVTLNLFNFLEVNKKYIVCGCLCTRMCGFARCRLHLDRDARTVAFASLAARDHDRP